jgi:hypothetical protein
MCGLSPDYTDFGAYYKVPRRARRAGEYNMSGQLDRINKLVSTTPFL